MVKMIALLRRKAGMSREDFIQYYETKHVPLILKHVKIMADYRRSYVVPGNMDVFALERDPTASLSALNTFDVLTEG